MNIVLDTNVLIAALLKESKVREIVVNSYNTFIVPSLIFSEILKHKEELLIKSGLDEADFNFLMMKISDYFMAIPNEIIKPYKEEADKIIGSIDKDDVPIIATSLAFNSCPIWTDDKHFEKQGKIKIHKTEDMIKLFEIEQRD